MDTANIDEIINDFNDLSHELLKQFCIIQPTSIISRNQDMINNEILPIKQASDILYKYNAGTPIEMLIDTTNINNIELKQQLSRFNNLRCKMIDIFVIKILPYKNDIDNSNEEKFLEGNFSNEVNGHNMVINIISDMKKIWPSLNNGDKTNLLQYIKYLSDLAQEYFKIKMM